MTIPIAIPALWRSIRRRYHGARAWLRSRIATCLLALLFGLSLSEPLVCVIHCQIWLPIVYRNYHAAMHHEHHARAHANSPLTPVGTSAHAGDVSGSIPPCAGFGPAGSPNPFYVPPAPIHDLVPALLGISIMLLLLAIALPPSSPVGPPQLAPPRLLRPPKTTRA